MKKTANKKNKIPEPTILRLSAYRHVLQDYKEQSAAKFVSSRQLGELANRNASIVRKDLSYFGEYGMPSKGYEIDHLLDQIVNIMNVKQQHAVALVGVGNLGKALLGYPGFKKQGFSIGVAFDNSARKIGKKIQEIKVCNLKGLPLEVARKEIKIAFITVPAAAAQEVANLLVEAGIRAIINFTPARIWVPPKVILRHVDLTRELEVASYYLGK